VRLHAVGKIVRPDLRHLDVEGALQALIDRLQTESRDGPLPANPEGVAM
jgi:hypothetical protein